VKNSNYRSYRKAIIAVVIVVLVALAAFFLFRSTLKPKKYETRRDAIGQVISLAGAGCPGVDDGIVSEATFSDPFGIAIDKTSSVLIADGGASNRIRRLTKEGKIETVAGSTEGFANGAASDAKFNTPSGIAMDTQGNLYIADTGNNRIRKLDATGQVTTVAGTGAAGINDGVALGAMFDAPIGIAVDKAGNLYVADTYNDRIRKITTDGQVTTLAGSGIAGYVDGQAEQSRFDTPCGIAVDEHGNVFVADTGNNAIRKITTQGEVTTLTRAGADEPNGNARLYSPVSLVLTPDHFLFITSSANGSIYRLTPEGELSVYAGSRSGFADGTGTEARLNGAAGIAADTQGNLYIADNYNYLIRKITPVAASGVQVTTKQAETYVQPVDPASAATDQSLPVIPKLSPALLHLQSPFPYPLQPQTAWHEIAGVVGEARGSFNGVALDHLHSGLDIAGKMGEACLSVMDEKVSAPISTWGFENTGEGIHVGVMSYIHIRIGRDISNKIQIAEKFKPRFDDTGKLIGVRVRRGTRFKVGDFIGTLNRLYHVHMNVGPANAQANAIQFPFANFKDTIAPVIEPNGIEVMTTDWQPFKQKVNNRLLINGDVRIVVTAYDRADGNNASRKLGLYRAGYQILKEDGSPVAGFEQPLMNIEFNRLPTDDAVTIVYAEGSGVSAYGTPTKFKYIVTNRVRDGEAREGLLRTSKIGAGNYLLRIVAEDYAGNRATGKATEIPITIR
jgi:sugar lactone lactonase YvrE